MTKGSDTSFSSPYVYIQYTIWYLIQTYYIVKKKKQKKNKRIRHKFFNLALSSPIWYRYALILNNFSKMFNMNTWNNKCSNKAECDNGISLIVTNQTDPRI